MAQTPSYFYRLMSLEVLCLLLSGRKTNGRIPSGAAGSISRQDKFYRERVGA